MTDELAHYTIPEELNNIRLDKALSALIERISRTQLKSAIEKGNVRVNDEIITLPKHKISMDDQIIIKTPTVEEYDPEPENIDLDIVYQDNDLLVINKQSGLVVHPGAGNYTGTLVNALLYHCKDDLSGIGGVKRPGIVHRLDKETTGLMVIAKNDYAHMKLSKQLSDRSLFRLYHCLVLGCPLPILGEISTLIGRDHANRLKMSTRAKNAKEAITKYKMVKNKNDLFSVVQCKLQTGRTHQIRVHMEFIKHPLIGDNLYGPQRTAVNAALKKMGASDETKELVLNFPRQALHAKELGFIHPTTNEELHFSSDYPTDLNLLINSIF